MVLMSVLRASLAFAGCPLQLMMALFKAVAKQMQTLQMTDRVIIRTAPVNAAPGR